MPLPNSLYLFVHQRIILIWLSLLYDYLMVSCYILTLFHDCIEYDNYLYVFIIHDGSYCLRDFNDIMITLTLLNDYDDWVDAMMIGDCHLVSSWLETMSYHSLGGRYDIAILYHLLDHLWCIYVLLCLVVNVGLQVIDIDST